MITLIKVITILFILSSCQKDKDINIDKNDDAITIPSSSKQDKIKIEVELNPDKPTPKITDLLKEEFKPLSEEEMKKLSKKLMENAQETFEEEK